MSIQIFEYDGTNLRGELIDGEPWWVGKDVCTILEITDHKQALSSLPEDEKRGVYYTTLKGEREHVCISEPGLYRLIFKSRKPEAERFKTWVVKEVLPQIRRTGRYAPEATLQTNPSSDLESRYLGLLDEHMALLKWKADFFEKQAQPKPKRPARKPLTDEERVEIKRLADQGMSGSAIAREIGRGAATISMALRVIEAQNDGEA